MVFQQFNLFPWLTVARNVAFGLEVAKLAATQRKERTDRFVRLVGLQGFSEHYPHELSGGMQQRVGLARALALDPDVLLLDEPFGALDAITREQLQREIAVILAQSPKTVVFITHNMDEAIFFSDRILVMGTRPGRILEEVRVDLPRPREADAVRASREFCYFEAEGNVARDSQPGKQVELLKYHRAGGRGCFHALSRYKNDTARCWFEPVQDTQQRGLAATAGTDD